MTIEKGENVPEKLGFKEIYWSKLKPKTFRGILHHIITNPQDNFYAFLNKWGGDELVMQIGEIQKLPDWWEYLNQVYYSTQQRTHKASSNILEPSEWRQLKAQRQSIIAENEPLANYNETSVGQHLNIRMHPKVA